MKTELVIEKESQLLFRLERLEAIYSELFDIANSFSSNDLLSVEGYSAFLLHSAANKVNETMKLLKRK